MKTLLIQLMEVYINSCYVACNRHFQKRKNFTYTYLRMPISSLMNIIIAYRSLIDPGERSFSVLKRVKSYNPLIKIVCYSLHSLALLCIESAETKKVNFDKQIDYFPVGSNAERKPYNIIHSFIHSGHFYSAPSSPLLLRGAPDYSTDTVSEFHAEAHRQLQVKDLPKVPTWRLERESNPRPSG